MEGNNLNFLQLLRLENCELWHLKNDQAHLKTKSFLQVLYASSPSELFVLRIGAHKWILDKSIEIIGTMAENEKYRLYLLPSHDGSYMIQVASVHAAIPLTNFETILENTVVFRCREGLEQMLETFHRNDGMVEKMEERVYEGITDLVGGIKKALSPYHESHPNQVIMRTFVELKDVDSHGTPVIDIPKEEIRLLQYESGEVNKQLEFNEYWKVFKDAGTEYWKTFHESSVKAQQRGTTKGVVEGDFMANIVENKQKDLNAPLIDNTTL